MSVPNWTGIADENRTTLNEVPARAGICESSAFARYFQSARYFPERDGEKPARPHAPKEFRTNTGKPRNAESL